jgi:hypothetical protein
MDAPERAHLSRRANTAGRLYTVALVSPSSTTVDRLGLAILAAERVCPARRFIWAAAWS